MTTPDDILTEIDSAPEPWKRLARMAYAAYQQHYQQGFAAMSADELRAHLQEDAERLRAVRIIIEDGKAFKRDEDAA